ncbi:hypothetical protein [Salinimicrobium terrae]|uniref:hypothetical protein n=1 Tax=Salinimicrobium terrae TaxID=470866 RepID=UPI000562B2CE|nr:hypothetical protein [Salinimicrobium terrae]
MKLLQTYLSLFLILTALPSIAQETGFEEFSEDTLVVEPQLQEEITFRRDTLKSEVHLNVLNLLVFGALDVGYERLINDHTSAGVEIFSKVFNKNKGEDTDLSKIYAKDFSITGKLKYFPQENKTAWGYYAQVFGMFSNGSNEVNMEFPNSETGVPEEKEVDMEYTDLAFGIGVGSKWVSKQGFLADVSFGIGRNLFDKYSPDIVILPSVLIGYRF